MERDIMTIDKNNEGAWRICENINGYLETKVYYFYTKKDAIKKFKEYKKNLINQQKGNINMNRYENYVREQFKKLKSTKYGFNIKIVDGKNNSTNYMELTPQKVELISKILKEKNNEYYKKIYA